MKNCLELNYWNDGSSTPQKMHTFKCYITEKTIILGMNCKIMGISIGNINKKQYENLMEDYNNAVKTSNIKQPKVR